MEIDLDSSIIIDLKLRLTEVIFKYKSILAPSNVLSIVGINSSLDVSLQVHDDYLRVVSSAYTLKEWIISNLESNCVEISELEVHKWHVFKYNRVVFEDVVLVIASLNRLALDGLNVGLKLFSLFSFELGQVSINEAKILSGERGYLYLNLWVKQELDCSLVDGLNLSDPMLLSN